MDVCATSTNRCPATRSVPPQVLRAAAAVVRPSSPSSAVFWKRRRRPKCVHRTLQNPAREARRENFRRFAGNYGNRKILSNHVFRRAKRAEKISRVLEYSFQDIMFGARSVPGFSHGCFVCDVKIVVTPPPIVKARILGSPGFFTTSSGVYITQIRIPSLRLPAPENAIDGRRGGGRSAQGRLSSKIVRLTLANA